jgi:exosome complex component MTR3
MATCIKSALEPAVCLHEFPNYQMDVFVNVLEDDGSVLAASIIAAGIAFADASIPMYDLIAASSVGVLHDSIIVDTTGSLDYI